MKTILGWTLASVLVLSVSAVAAPVAASDKYDAYVEIDVGYGEYPPLHATVYRWEPGYKTLRYIPVCLERWNGDHFATRSCKKTDAAGHVHWNLYQGHEYRIHVPATSYHYANYSETFST